MQANCMTEYTDKMCLSQTQVLGRWEQYLQCQVVMRKIYVSNVQFCKEKISMFIEKSQFVKLQRVMMLSQSRNKPNQEM